MGYKRIKRLTYERRSVSFRLPDFIIERLSAEKNKTKAVEKALMEYFKLEYP